MARKRTTKRNRKRKGKRQTQFDPLRSRGSDTLSARRDCPGQWQEQGNTPGSLAHFQSVPRTTGPLINRVETHRTTPADTLPRQSQHAKESAITGETSVHVSIFVTCATMSSSMPNCLSQDGPQGPLSAVLTWRDHQPGNTPGKQTITIAFNEDLTNGSSTG